MKFLTKMVLRVAAATALLCSLGAPAQAQVIRLGSTSGAPIAPTPPAYTCIATSSSAVQTLYFDPQTSGATDINWRLEGDYTLVSTPPLNATTVQFKPTGYGKLRVSVDYYINTGTTTGPITCGGSTITCTYPVRSFATAVTEFYKTFPTSAYLVKGPTCVPANNPSVVYSVSPALISTDAQIQTGIGTDSYLWTATYTSGPLINQAVPLAVSGATAVIQGNEAGLGTGDLKGSFTITVQVGKCNANTVTTTNVTVAPNLGNNITGFPSCVPIGTTSASFSLATQTGVNYTLSTQIGTLSSTSIVGNGSPQTISLSNLGTTATGNVTIIGVGGPAACFGTQTSILYIGRQLVPGTGVGQNQIPQTCVAASGTTTLTLTNPPVGQPLTWSISGSGWNIVSGQGTASIGVTPGTGSATVSVQAGSCGGGIVTKTIGVSGPVAGCSFSIANSGGSTPGCSFTASAVGSCPTNNNRFTAWRLYDGTTLLETKTISGSAQFTPSVSFDYSSNITGTARVDVDVANTSAGGQCLSATYSTTGLDFVACFFGRAANTALSTGTSSTKQNAVRVYPNPTGAQLQVDLVPTKGTTTLSLVDALGRVQQTTTTTQAHATLDVSRLAEGVYTLRATLPDGNVSSQKVLVKH